MVLDRNPDNFFAETEQVAFCTANVVPGIDFTNDPLLQFRNFSYLDTQLIRLGGPNFAQLPINRPVAEVHNNQHDGYGQQTIPRGKSSYYPNSVGGGCPALAGSGLDEGVFRHYTERVDGAKIRKRAASFENHYSQPRMFFASMSATEAEHIVAAYAFELGKCERVAIRRRVVELLAAVDHGLARRVAEKLRLPAPDEQSVPEVELSPALSQLADAGTATRADAVSIETRKIAVLAADGVDVVGVERFIAAMRERGAIAEVLAPVAGGELAGGSGGSLTVDRAFTTMASVLYDAVVVPCGPDAVTALAEDGYAVHFVAEAYKHLKPIGAFGAGVDLLSSAGMPEQLKDDAHGVVTTAAAAADLDDEFFDAFAAALSQHRSWDSAVDAVPA